MAHQDENGFVVLTKDDRKELNRQSIQQVNCNLGEHLASGICKNCNKKKYTNMFHKEKELSEEEKEKIVDHLINVERKK